MREAVLSKGSYQHTPITLQDAPNRLQPGTISDTSYRYIGLLGVLGLYRAVILKIITIAPNSRQCGRVAPKESDRVCLIKTFWLLSLR